ncbi:MAG: hypothetical protein ABSF12_10320 [Bryobacteraceae bacterium]|jgi:hypothetical protein
MIDLTVISSLNDDNLLNMTVQGALMDHKRVYLTNLPNSMWRELQLAASASADVRPERTKAKTSAEADSAS